MMPSEWKLEQIVVSKGIAFEMVTFADFDAQVCAELNKSGDDKELESWPLYGQIWPAALSLSRALIAEKEAGRLPSAGLKVAEVGCGLALPSMVMAKLGYRVTAFDAHPNAQKLVHYNLKTNKISDENLVFRCGDVLDADFQFDDDTHLILASDILYEPWSYQAFADKFLSWTHHPPFPRIILSDPGRVHLDEFIGTINSMNLNLCRLDFDSSDKNVVLSIEAIR